MIDSSETQPIAIIGLGYVGLPPAVEFGKHRPVIGFDINSMGANVMRGFGKADHVLYDLKNVLDTQESDLRL